MPQKLLFIPTPPDVFYRPSLQGEIPSPSLRAKLAFSRER